MQCSECCRAVSDFSLNLALLSCLPKCDRMPDYSERTWNKISRKYFKYTCSFIFSSTHNSDCVCSLCDSISSKSFAFKCC